MTTTLEDEEAKVNGVHDERKDGVVHACNPESLVHLGESRVVEDIRDVQQCADDDREGLIAGGGDHGGGQSRHDETFKLVRRPDDCKRVEENQSIAYWCSTSGCVS